MSDSLRPRQSRFVEEYLVDLNAAQAAIRAGYSARSARKNSYRLLRKTAVREAVAQAMGARSERTQISADQVLREYARLAFSNIADFVDFGPDGVTVRALSEMPRDAARCVAEVSESKTGRGGTTRLKLHDKKGALDALARNLGMFVERHQHTGAGGGPMQVENVPELSDIERLHRIEALLERAGKRRDRQAADRGDAGVDAAQGAADRGV